MSLVANGPIVIAGVGKMGSALLERLISRGINTDFIKIQDPSPSDRINELVTRHHISCHARIEKLERSPSIIILAVKPQVMDSVFPPLSKLAGPETIILSIAAGRTLSSFEKNLPPNTGVVRAMPNTPAQVGRGITACVSNSALSSSQRQFATQILSCLGQVIWLDHETDMDAVTAVSGSGPAYVFHFVECLTEAGIAEGLSPNVAAQLARATVVGAGELLAGSDLEAAKLRENVTSEGGTTAAALTVLMGSEGLQKLLSKAVQAASRRSRELSR